MTWTGLHLRRRGAEALRTLVLGALDRAILALEPPEATAFDAEGVPPGADAPPSVSNDAAAQVMPTASADALAPGAAPTNDNGSRPAPSTPTSAAHPAGPPAEASAQAAQGTKRAAARAAAPLPALPKPRAPRAARTPRARPTEAPPLPEAPPPPPPEQRLQVAREREQRREARARPGILQWLDGCGGEAKTVALMQHVAEDFKISGQRFSVLLEELQADGLIAYTPATQTVALTEAGRAATASR